MNSADIAVLAGNGKSGRRVAAALRVAGHRTRVAGRKGPVRFDWHEPATWPELLDGADAVYVVAPGDDAGPVPSFVDAAVAAGVARLVMLSGRGFDHWDGRFGDTMVATEQAVRASGRGTVLRSSNFAQNFTEELWEPAVRTGRLALPGQRIADSLIDLGDVAAVAARVLTEPGHEDRVYELTGPESLTLESALAILAAATDRDLRYEPLTPEAYADELRTLGLGEADVAELVGLWAIMAEGHLDGVSDDVPRLLGRPARAFGDWAVEQAAVGAWGV
ncbi:NAD(P)H-binding protein [Actinomycetospora sp. OC33-EN08]|uniref:NAD(P)H-binding protein n=1 Tax=Actinomycetospora aurantiaca TaxID=3129233 RepID=A0ABU8MHR4_9PSEU